MLERILEIIFPKCCGICGRLYKDWICPKCYYKLKSELKYSYIQEKNFKLFYLGEYEKTIRQLLLKFKFKESAYLANIFIEVICKNQKFIQNIKHYDCIIPIPMYEKNKKIRGYNQTELLAQKICKNQNINYMNNVLIKVKENKRQSELDGNHRIQNVENVYKLQNGELIKDKKVLLIDDIYTTGSTVNSAIKELKKTKIEDIGVLVIAKTI